MPTAATAPLSLRLLGRSGLDVAPLTLAAGCTFEVPNGGWCFALVG